MESIIIKTNDLPSMGKYYKFKRIILSTIEVLPAEPITKPIPTTIPRPKENDPFNVPAPLVDPTPKGFF